MKKSTAQALSFLSGMTVAVVIIGVTISKSPELRREIEAQLKSVLKTTRFLVDSYKGLATKSRAAISLIKNDATEKTTGKMVEESISSSNINKQWDAIEESYPRG